MDDEVNYRVKLISPISKALLHHAGVRPGNTHLRRALLNFFDPIVPPKLSDNIYVEDVQVPVRHLSESYSIGLRIFAPGDYLSKQNELPLLIWCHGGGYAIGSPFAKTTDSACRGLAKAAGLIILAVGKEIKFV